jgi:hypothetical protein
MSCLSLSPEGFAAASICDRNDYVITYLPESTGIKYHPRFEAVAIPLCVINNHIRSTWRS